MVVVRETRGVRGAGWDLGWRWGWLVGGLDGMMRREDGTDF